MTNLLIIFLTTLTAALCFDINEVINIEDEKFHVCVEESGYEIDQDEPLDFKDTPTIELLCLMKCVAEVLEVVDEEGNIIQENLAEFEEALSEEKYSMFTECLKDAPKVKTCQDMDYPLQCLASLQ